MEIKVRWGGQEGGGGAGVRGGGGGRRGGGAPHTPRVEGGGVASLRPPLLRAALRLRLPGVRHRRAAGRRGAAAGGAGGRRGRRGGGRGDAHLQGACLPIVGVLVQ